MAIYANTSTAAANRVELPIVLTGEGDSIVLDYGHEVAGTPYFSISAVDSPVQLEIRYSEELQGLASGNGDGPYAFSQGLSSTFRTETFNITSAAVIRSYFVQGGQRWQSITQLTTGQINIEEVGFEPSVDLPDLENTNGHFECSNPDYNKIWKLGALAASAACLKAGSQRSTWDVTDDGALIRGQKPAITALANGLVNYNLTFMTKIMRGGTGWSIAQDTSSQGLQLLLVSDLPEESTYVNTNTTLLPPNSVVLAYGWSFVNQSTLPSLYLDSFKVPVTVTEDTWYKITTKLLNATFLTVTIDDTLVLDVSLSDYGVVPMTSFNPFATPGAGSFGFGPWQDQVALIKDVQVVGQNGSTLYQNPMTSSSILSEYGVAQNEATVCLDGPKRDRLVWLGDFFHTARIIPASTTRREDVLGTLQYFIKWQNERGLFPVSPPMGYGPEYAPQVGAYDFLQDYQTLGLLALTGYYGMTKDIDLARQVWPGFQRQISWLLSQVNATTGLAEISGFTGPAAGTATSCQLIEALKGAAVIATDLGDIRSATNYTSVAQTISDAVYSSLWNEDLGVYATSLAAASNFSVADISFAITSGVAAFNSTRVQSLLRALNQLRLGPGYKDTSAVEAGPEINISPNINGFLLSALMEVNDTQSAKFLLDNLWTAMIANESTYTGGSWEYVRADDLSPGLDLFTSLSHPWGGAPTYVLPQMLAGVRPITAGYERWVVVPGIEGFNLTSASARVPTLKGILKVSWTLDQALLRVNISAPEGTSGSLVLPGKADLGSWTLDGGTNQGGKTIELGSGDHTVSIRT